MFVSIKESTVNLTVRYYFSDEYKKKSYRSLSLFDEKIDTFSESLITLENDTVDIIEYVEYQKDKNKKKYYFWELLKND